ncbi:hypothetical protein NA647_00360 [Pseudomonas stutzeri]|uniref:hypothetical protein n=1 Tax=Stutzerimonas stutzeri TaxID=316 RepID=UPI0021090D41|nr:hypothetical protein [Stutzerimonas stutzeri]MCQ4285889.1 hypothetical protein [Stutzerimonas stutzeri]
MRPEWFKARSLLGYGFDWPLDWREMWRYYEEVEQALKISGPVRYPWGPKLPRYPYRQHEINASGMDLRRLGVSNPGRGQPVADHPGDRLPNRRSHTCAGRTWRALM